MTKVFISYSRKDIAFIEQLAADLKLAGVDAWYDLSGLDGGSLWRKGIEKAIRESQYVIVVLSPNSVESEWVDEEIVFAKSLKRKIIPLIYKPCEIPFGLHTRNYIDVQGDKYKKNYKEVLRALGIKRSESEYIEKDQPEPKERLPIFYWLAGLVVLIFGIIFLSSLNTPTYAPQPTLENTKAQVVATSTQDIIVPSLTLTLENTSTAIPEATVTPTPLPTEITDAKGVNMKLISEGEFAMGLSANEAYGFCQTFQAHMTWYGNPCKVTDYYPEDPMHQVFLNNYYIDEYEVSNGEYKKCVQEQRCQAPIAISADMHSKYWDNEFYVDYPVIYVTWGMAQTYCEWRDARLPTEAEWEKAARGVNAFTFPWGKYNPAYKIYEYSFYTNKANLGLGGEKSTMPVDSNSDGLSPYGIYNMAGNVAEWVADWYGEKYYSQTNFENPLGPLSGDQKVIRGGSINSHDVRTTLRDQMYPIEGRSTIGIRCAKDAE